MGKRTSIYLSDDQAAAVKASGLSLGELVRRGLNVGNGEDVLRRILEETLTRVLTTHTLSAAQIKQDSSDEYNPALLPRAGTRTTRTRKHTHARSKADAAPTAAPEPSPG